MLEQRIAALTAALETRERPQPAENTEQLEGAIRALSDRIDRMQVGNDSASAFAHLEQRVSYLLERLESLHRSRAAAISAASRTGCTDILRHLERQHATFSALAEAASSAPAPRDRRGLVDLVKRELSDIRYSQSETNRRTQDSLEAVHNTLGHVVDRLAMIEGDLRAVRTAPPAPAPAAPMPIGRAPARPRPRRAAADGAQRSRSRSAELRCRSPNCRIPPPRSTAHSTFAAAPREFHAAAPAAPPPAPMAPVPPRAISEILEPHAAPAARRDRARTAAGSSARARHASERPRLPRRRSASPRPKARSAKFHGAPKEPVSSSSFIAAARRAAQAAAAAASQREGRPRRKQGCRQGQGRRQGQGGQEGASTITSKIRSLLVGASVVVIVLGTFKMAMTLLDTRQRRRRCRAMENRASQPASRSRRRQRGQARRAEAGQRRR